MPDETTGAQASNDTLEEQTTAPDTETVDQMTSVPDEAAQQSGATAPDPEKASQMGGVLDEAAKKGHTVDVSPTGAKFKPGIAHHGGKAGVTRVKITHLQQQMDAGTKAMNELYGMLDTMQSWMIGGGEGGQGGSSAYWEGTAADRFREVFAAEMNALRQDLEELGGFPRELEYYITAHQEADLKAQKLVAGLDEALWIDV